MLLEAERADDRVLLEGLLDLVALAGLEADTVVLSADARGLDAVRRLLVLLPALADADWEERDDLTVGDLVVRLALGELTALLVAAGLVVFDALLVLRRVRRWIFRRASINSSFRIECQPVTSCWRARSAKSRRVWVFNSAVVIKRLLPVALKVGLNSVQRQRFSAVCEKMHRSLWGRLRGLSFL